MPPSATIGGPAESLSRKRLTGEVKQSTEDEGWEEQSPAAILGLHPLSVPDAAGEAPENSPQGEARAALAAGPLRHLRAGGTWVPPGPPPVAGGLFVWLRRERGRAFAG